MNRKDLDMQSFANTSGRLATLRHLTRALVLSLLTVVLSDSRALL